MMTDLKIRQAVPQDCSAVLQLMRELAQFEGYLADFKVDRLAILSIIEKQGDTGILVAEQCAAIIGILVYFYQPFTYDLTPWLIIKELYVRPSARGTGAGKALFNAAVMQCKARGGGKVKWEVLTANKPAQHFYTAQGAILNDDWQIMSVRLSD